MPGMCKQGGNVNGFYVRLTMEGEYEDDQVYILDGTGKVVERFDITRLRGNDDIGHMIKRIRMAYEMPEQFRASIKEVDDA